MASPTCRGLMRPPWGTAVRRPASTVAKTAPCSSVYFFSKGYFDTQISLRYGFSFDTVPEGLAARIERS